jgi:hypothetical protein
MIGNRGVRLCLEREATLAVLTAPLTPGHRPVGDNQCRISLTAAV